MKFDVDDLGSFDIKVLNSTAFAEVCSVRSPTDNTGLRIYPGTQVALRFCIRNSFLLDRKTCCELGCGAGVLGSMLPRIGPVRNVVLTDGSWRAVELALENKERISRPEDIARLECRVVGWGSAEEDELVADYPDRFDLVVGCELMYYNTDIQALLSTVFHLVAPGGLFLHAHVFRDPLQSWRMQEILTQNGWKTLEAKLEDFVPLAKLADYPTWASVQCLLSGNSEVIQSLHLSYPARFTEFQPSAGEENDVFQVPL